MIIIESFYGQKRCFKSFSYCSRSISPNIWTILKPKLNVLWRSLMKIKFQNELFHGVLCKIIGKLNETNTSFKNL